MLRWISVPIRPRLEWKYWSSIRLHCKILGLTRFAVLCGEGIESVLVHLISTQIRFLTTVLWGGIFSFLTNASLRYQINHEAWRMCFLPESCWLTWICDSVERWLLRIGVQSRNDHLVSFSGGLKNHPTALFSLSSSWIWQPGPGWSPRKALPRQQVKCHKRCISGQPPGAYFLDVKERFFLQVLPGLVRELPK